VRTKADEKEKDEEELELELDKREALQQMPPPELLKEDEEQVESEDGPEDPVAAGRDTDTFTIFQIRPKNWQRLNR